MPVAKAAYRRTARGLFGLKGLSEPGHWEDLATRCIGRCTELAQDTLAGPPGPGTIHYIDQISDEVILLGCTWGTVEKQCLSMRQCRGLDRPAGSKC